MQRRGLSAVLLAAFMWGGMTAAAAASTQAASPGPALTPPPQCFVVKDGALPTCEQAPNGTWTVTYPTGGGNLDSGTGGGERHTVEIIVVIVAIAGIGVIVWRTWLRPDTAGGGGSRRQASLGAARAAPGDAGLNVSYAAPPIVQQPPPAAAPVPPTAEGSAAQRLAELNALRNSGGITPADYEARRQSILGEI
ncbi:MAG TPA: hypothetical protein VHV76_15975 [Mycobacteriales bacterium]|jgi:hypothetical protein|nr:hypothetical protein [Mycobacteriales bacterium]